MLARLRAGDEAAFAALYRDLHPRLLAFVHSLLANRASAEEVAQDCWLTVVDRIDQFEGRGSLAGWIFTIAANGARQRGKRDGRMINIGDLARADTPDPGDRAFDARGRWRDPPARWLALREDRTAEDILADRDMLAHLHAAIAALPPAQRAVMILRAQMGLEPAEICRILSISDANLRVLTHRARSRLRRSIEDHLR